MNGTPSSGLRVIVLAAGLSSRMGEPKALARRVLREHSGGRVLIIGHINTVPEIVAALADRSDIPKIDEQDFGVMYIVTVPRIGHANFVRLNY